jgi:hypothetical protein
LRADKSCKKGERAMKTKQVLIMSSILCLAFIRAPAKLVTNASTFTSNEDIHPAFCGYDFQISVDPALPTIEDTIQVGIFGEWGNSCIPWYHSHQVVGNVIEINFVHDYPPDTLCFAVITPWGCTVDVGILASGIYEVGANINGFCCGNRSFVVFDELRQLYLPVIARLSGGSE